jgi:hypothetical protein
MVTCHEPLSCRTALDEATTLWPGRRRTSDGICASAAHHQQNPGSDHEPHIIVNGHGYASAFDLSDDKLSGCDADWLAEQLRIRRDPRIKYVIAERRMYSSYSGTDSRTGRTFQPWEWRPYYGSNPHSSHVHVSVLRSHLFNPDPWWGPLLEDDDMAFSEKDSANLEKMVELLEAMNHEIAGPVDKNSRLGNLVVMVRDIKSKLMS